VTTEIVDRTAGPAGVEKGVEDGVEDGEVSRRAVTARHEVSAVSFIDNFLLVVSDTLFSAETLELGREKVKGFTSD